MKKSTKANARNTRRQFTNQTMNFGVSKSKHRAPYTEPWEARSFLGNGEPIMRIHVYSIDRQFGRSQRFFW